MSSRIQTIKNQIDELKAEVQRLEAEEEKKKKEKPRRWVVEYHSRSGTWRRAAIPGEVFSDMYDAVAAIQNHLSAQVASRGEWAEKWHQFRIVPYTD